MRYYIYLDRQLLKTLFAVLDEGDFNIEIIDFAERKSYSKNNEISIDPCIENGNNFECFKSDDNEIKKKNNNFNSEKLRLQYDKEFSCNVQTERKYINVSDVSDIKNIKFYHQLVLNIQKASNLRTGGRLYEEEGFINIYPNRDQDEKVNESECFFRINNTCVWYDKLKLDGDINMLRNLGCKIKVVGYLVNCLDDKFNKVLKAVAIYIE